MTDKTLDKIEFYVTTSHRFENQILLETIYGITLKKEFSTKEEAEKAKSQLESKLAEAKSQWWKSNNKHCPTCHSKFQNYTKIPGGKRSNCCDHNVHFDECEHGDCSCKCHEIQSQHANLVKAIQDRRKSLPIYCVVCGEKLTMGSTGPHTPSWGCSHLFDDGTKKLKHKPNRSIADKHYSDSRRYMTFEQFKHYEQLDQELQNLLESVKRTTQ